MSLTRSAGSIDVLSVKSVLVVVWFGSCCGWPGGTCVCWLLGFVQSVSVARLSSSSSWTIASGRSVDGTLRPNIGCPKTTSYGACPINECLWVLTARIPSGSAVTYVDTWWSCIHDTIFSFKTPLPCPIRPWLCGWCALPFITWTPWHLININTAPLNSFPLSRCRIQGAPRWVIQDDTQMQRFCFPYSWSDTPESIY